MKTVYFDRDGRIVPSWRAKARAGRPFLLAAYDEEDILLYVEVGVYESDGSWEPVPGLCWRIGSAGRPEWVAARGWTVAVLAATQYGNVAGDVV